MNISTNSQQQQRLQPSNNSNWQRQSQLSSPSQQSSNTSQQLNYNSPWISPTIDDQNGFEDDFIDEHSVSTELSNDSNSLDEQSDNNEECSTNDISLILSKRY